MSWVGGRLLDATGVKEGVVRLDDRGRVDAVERGETGVDVDHPGVVVPAPTNAHTHLGDRLARERYEIEGLSVQEAVAPPDGLKHRILRRASQEQITKSIAQALREAHRAGARRVLDFREGGPAGAKALRDAASEVPIETVCLGRPQRPETWEREREELVERVDGIGISGLGDQPIELSRQQSDWAHEHGKRVALHLSETEREDTEAALGLEPDLLVHCTQCTDADVERIAQAGVSVAACPRSNRLFGRRPPLAKLLEAGITVGLGTDNAMFHEPDVLAEAAFVAREWPSLEADTILATACRFHLPGEKHPGLEQGARVVLVDDRDGLRAGLERERFQAPGRIDDERNRD